jgi:hypothetical protein
VTRHDPIARAAEVAAEDDGSAAFIALRPRLLGIADETLDPLDSLVKRDTLSRATLRLMERGSTARGRVAAPAPCATRQAASE